MFGTRRPTLKGMYESVLVRHGDRPAIQFENRTMTYADLDVESASLARAFHDLGLTPEDRIGLVMSNRLAYVSCDIAIARSGLAKVPINDMLAPEDIEYMLQNAKVKAVIVGPNFVDTIEDLAPRVDTLEHVVVVEMDPAHNNWISLEALIEDYPANPPEVSVDSEQLAGVFHTGGTTGNPKGVVHTQGNLALNAIGHAVELEINPSDRLLLMTPLPHVAGLVLAGGLTQGCRHLITQGFDAEEALRLIQTEEITWTFMVPTMIYRILDLLAADTHPYDTSSLQTLVYGAAPMKPERLREGLDSLGNVFLQLYGQYESPDLITILPKDEHDPDNPARLQSCGGPALMSEVSIVNDDGCRVAPGEVGEIVVRSAYTMKGYFDQSEQTAETLADGWLHTGDIGTYDADGFFYILDRKADVVVSGGMNVYTNEVENVVQKHDQVHDVAVIGVPDDDWGEAVKAVIVGDDNLSEPEIMQFCNQHLARYKEPKSIEFVSEFPTTPYGKTDKKALREPYWENQDRDIS